MYGVLFNNYKYIQITDATEPQPPPNKGLRDR